jgi:hypothetical protein
MDALRTGLEGKEIKTFVGLGWWQYGSFLFHLYDHFNVVLSIFMI